MNLSSDTLKARALEYLQEHASPSLVSISMVAAVSLMNTHYPTRWEGFVHDCSEAEKTC